MQKPYHEIHKEEIMPVKRTNWFMIILVAAALFVITLLAGKNGQIVYLFLAFANSVIGGAIALLFDLAKTHGQSYTLWFQSRCCKKTDRIRISFSYLFRICIDGKYLLVRGNRLKNQYQPIGGVYKYYPEAKKFLESIRYAPDVKMKNNDETDDLRLTIRRRCLLEFVEWFQSMEDREYDPLREFREELIEAKILPKDEFKYIKYRKLFVHNKGIQYSTYTECNELLYADIFELELTIAQKEFVRKALKDKPNEICAATEEEMRKLCYNGIEKNLGTNTPWILEE